MNFLPQYSERTMKSKITSQREKEIIVPDFAVLKERNENVSTDEITKFALPFDASNVSNVGFYHIFFIYFFSLSRYRH